MAEEILVKEPLTKEMIEVGEELQRRLITTGVRIAACFWLFDREANRWQLTVASPEVDDEGSRVVYGKVWDILYGGPNGIRGLDLPDVTVLGANDKFVRALAGYNALTTLSEKRLSGFGLNGIYIEDIYIYFIGSSIKPLSGSHPISK